MLDMADTLALQESELVQKVVAGKALIALDQVQLVLISPVEIYGADGLGL